MLDSFDGAWLGKTILSLGEPSFAQTLILALEPFVPVDHLSVLVFDHELAAHLASAASRQPGNAALEAGKRYERGRFYRHDPGTRLLGASSGRGSGADSGAHDGGGPVLSRLRAAELTDERYRREIYDRYRLLERLSIIDRVRERWLMLNLYRSRGSEPFREREIAGIRASSTLLASLAGKHVALLAASAAPRRNRVDATRYLDDLLTTIESRLTPRERTVCARALAGQTVRGISSELGVRPPTVATLRRRAYAKLNISSLNELFARCIEQLARGRAEG